MSLLWRTLLINTEQHQGKDGETMMVKLYKDCAKGYARHKLLLRLKRPPYLTTKVPFIPLWPDPQGMLQ